MDFYLPEDFGDLTLDSLIVHIATEGGWNQVPNTAVYDWDRDAWDELENPNTGANLIQAVQGLVSESDVVRIRIESQEGFTGACYYLGLGVEGSW